MKQIPIYKYIVLDHLDWTNLITCSTDVHVNVFLNKQNDKKVAIIWPKSKELQVQETKQIKQNLTLSELKMVSNYSYFPAVIPTKYPHSSENQPGPWNPQFLCTKYMLPGPTVARLKI